MAKQTVLTQFGISDTLDQSTLPSRRPKGEVLNTNTFLRYARKPLALLAFVALPVASQTGLGVVHGTVRDTSDAVLSNVKVILTNTATGVVRDGATNSAGVYYFGSVQIGPYQLVV